MPAAKMIAGTGILIVGTGAVLVWMGLKDYSLQTVLNAALKGGTLVPELSGDNIGMIGPANVPDATGGGGGKNMITGVTPAPGFDTIGRASSLFEEAGINWDGGHF